MLSQDHPWNNLKLEFKEENNQYHNYVKEPEIKRKKNLSYSKPKKSNNFQYNYHILDDKKKCHCNIS
tara:strand:- start:22 stop:222 length:201 start_codon:yes stop_codon:yes gene_type:complete